MAGHPYLSLSYFPYGARSVFAYSIDGDGLLTEGVDALIDVAKKTGTRFVFYINKQLCENDPDLKEKLLKISEENIIAGHGAIHNGKDSYEENIEDLRIFDEWMESLGVPFERSYAAPRGMYCHELGRALKDMGYRHSRDFGCAIDDVPFYPYCEGRQDTVLQIPCDGFNVCRLLGKREEEGLPKPTAEEIIAMYERQIDRKLERGEPLLFFCHPQYFGLYAREVYPAIVEYVKERDVLLTDYAAYGDFWIRRDGAAYDADCADGRLEINKKEWPDDVLLLKDGKPCEG